MKIGIIGAGAIAGTMARTVSKMKGAELCAIASRDIKKAQDFAKEFKAKKAYGSYQELCDDSDVELVYIATPHAFHAQQAEMCAKSGKPVLCEKAFTMNAGQAKKIAALFAEKKLYLAEAMWTRYMPSRKSIDQILQSGIIGKVKALSANLSYSIESKERLVKPELAGGALLDVGVYALNFSLMHFGHDIERVESSVQMTAAGVDKNESISLYYKDGRVARLAAGMDARSDRKGIFWGEKGYVVVENINNPNLIQVFDSNDKLLKRVKVPKQFSGYEYEVAEAIEKIKAGAIQSQSMPLDDSIFLMELMDRIRKDWGMVYPQERA